MITELLEILPVGKLLIIVPIFWDVAKLARYVPTEMFEDDVCIVALKKAAKLESLELIVLDWIAPCTEDTTAPRFEELRTCDKSHNWMVLPDPKDKFGQEISEFDVNWTITLSLIVQLLLLVIMSLNFDTIVWFM